MHDTKEDKRERNWLTHKHKHFELQCKCRNKWSANEEMNGKTKRIPKAAALEVSTAAPLHTKQLNTINGFYFSDLFEQIFVKFRKFFSIHFLIFNLLCIFSKKWHQSQGTNIKDKFHPNKSKKRKFKSFCEILNFFSKSNNSKSNVKRKKNEIQGF